MLLAKVEADTHSQSRITAANCRVSFPESWFPPPRNGTMCCGFRNEFQGPKYAQDTGN